MKIFESPIYNQLSGFIRTPPLWHGKALFEMQQFKFPYINLPNFNEFNNPLPQLSTQFVLGKRVEIFFKELVNQSSDYNIILNNIQIFRGKITLGEIDFILDDLLNNNKIHLELVYKFYVYDPSYTLELDRWVGPNRKDTLQQKINKLKQHQFAMVNRPEATQTLKEFEVDSYSLIPQVCFKANLFVPRSLKNNELPLINNDCVVGYYINYEEFQSAEFKSSKYHIPRKQDWVALAETNELWTSFSDIQDELTSHLNKKKSPLIWRKIDDNTFERFFVVWW